MDRAERLTGWELIDPESSAAGTVAGEPSSAAGAPSAAAGVRRPSPEQEHAISRRGEPLLLAAGAGSGKTAVLVERFVRAVCEDGTEPGRILAITFTERAADELRERVRARLRALGEDAAARAIDGAFVGTFHGFCARLLRAESRAAGIEEGFEILDEGLSGRLRRRAFADALEEFVSGGRPEAVDLIAAYTADRARAIVLGSYAELRSRGQRAPELPAPALESSSVAGQEKMSSDEERAAQRALDEQGARAIALWNELLRRFGERYEAAKRAREGLDFDDLELLAGALLTNDERIARTWAARFELLMVDELQDVNQRQLALVQALERDNLFTVGDEWQSIYGFRHADVNLFRARDAQLAPRGQSLRLEHNFRGHGELLQAVNAVFAARFGERFTPLRAGRQREREREAHGQSRLDLLLTHRRGWDAASAPAGEEGMPTAASWRVAEARALAERVSELLRAGAARPGAVAVLLRAMGDIDCYERALREQGLQTIASAGAFWVRQEVVDLLAYLRALADPQDELALYGALAAPPVGMSSDGLALLARAAVERERGLWEVARALGTAPEVDAGRGGGDGSEQRRRAAELCARLERERAQLDQLTLPQLLGRELEQGSRVTRLGAGAGGERRLANVRKLVELAGEWERSEGRDLRGFLEEAAFQQRGGGRIAAAEAIAEPDAPTGDEHMEAVRLMSVHAAKGLEFDVVCLADLGRTPSTGVPDLLVGGERIGVRLIGLEDPEPRPALDFEELAAERREAQSEEEDRIVYVAMTRARERLLLSGAVDFASWPRERPGAAPIAWLGPALVAELPLLCAQALAGPPGRRDLPLRVDGTDVPMSLTLNAPSAHSEAAPIG